MKKFIIVDQSLCNLQGHHYECSVSVAEAAARRGYKAIIIANKVFSQKLYPENIKVISAFEVDWFNNSTIENHLPFWKKFIKQITSFFEDLSFQKIGSNLLAKIDYKLWEISLKKPPFKLFIEKVQGSTFRLGVWFQKDLQLLQYIPFANTVWGLLKIVFGLFRFFVEKTLKFLGKIWLKLFKFPAKTFINSLKQALQKIQVSSEDLIFIHTLGIEQLEQLLYWLESLDNSSIPNYHIMLRRDIKDPLVTEAKGIGIKACLNRFYNSKLSPHKVQFYTDTQQLVERYNTLSPVKFSEIPVPFRQEKLKQNQQFREQNKPIHIVYLGDARREKGYHFLPEVIASLWKDYISPKKVKFTIQSNLSISGGETDILAARLQLEQYPDEQVKLIKEIMEAEGYYQLLNDADLMIIPYDINSYRYRSSGVFTESLAAGKPVIVPENSWLATQVDETRSGIYHSPKDIPKTIIKIIENLDKYTKSASEFSLIWKEKHSPDQLINCILNSSNLEQVTKQSKAESMGIKNTPKILYIAEGDSLVKKNINGLITLSHLEYLSKCGYQIYLVVYGLDVQFRKDNFENFADQVRAVIKNYTLAETWLLNYQDRISFFEGLDWHKYVKQVYNNQWSLSRNLIDINSLNLSPSLASYLQEQNFDNLFIDNLASWGLVKKLGLKDIPSIYQMSYLYSYEYAIQNNQNLDLEEFNLEKKILAKCQVILCQDEPKLAKIKEAIPESSIYLLPSPISANQEAIFSGKDNRIDFIWKNKSNEYEEVMNNAFQEILGKQALSFPNMGKNQKIAILYPWEDILERKAGASKRVGLLIDYLQAENYQIWLFSPGDKPEILEPKVRYTFYQQEWEKLALVKEVYSNSYDAWLQLENFNQSGEIKTINPQIIREISQDWRLNMYYQFRFDSNFINWIEQITDWADVIILEYPFWAKTVSKICQEKQVKLIITAHDAIYKQVKEKSIIKKILLLEEISSLKTANQVVSVSNEDEKLLSKYGVKSTVIPNPVDFSKNNINESSTIPLKIKENYPWLEENYCLFVGSKHFPNLEAVKQIKIINDNYSQKQESIPCKFVIVGSCCEPENHDNFIALGKVEFELLKILYQQAKLIISPMLSGTGSSLKIIEAMSYGKVILGTKIAFRGYNVASEINCIVSDKITEYPHLISQLLLDSAKIKIIGNNAQKFAHNYDYRELYQIYNKLIQQSI